MSHLKLCSTCGWRIIDCVTVAGNVTVVNTTVTESGESSSSHTGAVVGGVVAGLVALGAVVVGVVLYSKVLAGKTAISTLQSTTTGLHCFTPILYSAS